MNERGSTVDAINMEEKKTYNESALCDYRRLTMLG